MKTVTAMLLLATAICGCCSGRFDARTPEQEAVDVLMAQEQIKRNTGGPRFYKPDAWPYSLPGYKVVGHLTYGNLITIMESTVVTNQTAYTIRDLKDQRVLAVAASYEEALARFPDSARFIPIFWSRFVPQMKADSGREPNEAGEPALGPQSLSPDGGPP